MDVGYITAHEMGHAYGLGHSSVSGAVSGAVMWPFASHGDTTHRRLQPDDSLGITALYPRTATNNHAPVITSTPPRSMQSQA